MRAPSSTVDSMTSAWKPTKAKSPISESRIRAWCARLVSSLMTESPSRARAITLSWELVSLPISNRLSGAARRTVFPATNDRSPIKTSP